VTWRTSTIAAIMLTALCAPLISADLDRTARVRLFTEASDLFRRANEAAAGNPAQADDLYSQAIMRYERIVREGGVQNGKLYYNIGNAYFRKGDLGRAILNYRLAERLMPNDPNLKQNLAAARRRRLDSIPEKQRTRVLKTVFFWHYDLSARIRTALFVLLFAALWVLAAVRLILNRPILTWALVVTAALSGLLAGSLVVQDVQRARHIDAVILAGEVVARKGDGETYEPSFTDPLHQGAEVGLIEERRDWRYVELADGRRCWLPAKSLGIIR